MSMNATEMKAEIASRFVQVIEIEKKYPDGLTPDANHEDFEESKRLLGEIDQLEDKLGPQEDAEQRKQRILSNNQKYNGPATRHQHAGDFDPNQWPELKDIGSQFVESSEWKQMSESGQFNSPKNLVQFNVPLAEGTSLIDAMLRKALITSGTGSGGGLVLNDQRPGIVDILQRQLSILDLIPRTATQSDTIEYVREDTFTNSAAFTAEATATTGTSGTKPESTLGYSTQTSPVKTLAHWIPITNRMLADAPALRGIINQRLLLGLNLALESQIIDGDGAGDNLTGIMRTSGTLIQGIGSDNAADAIFKARTQVMVTGLGRPNAVVMHPNDFQAIRLMRENAATGTLGGYLYGPPSVAGPATIWGYPVVEAIGAVENTAIVGDFAMGGMLFDREQGAIRTGLINDQFVRNMQTVLAELRISFVLFRPSLMARVTGV